MDNTLLLDTVRAGHLVGLALGFGPAICADVLVAKSFFRPIRQRDVDLLKWLHMIVFAGVALLWITGLILLQIRTGFDLANFSPKLMTKVFVVVLLTGNAMAIGIYALPRFNDHVGVQFGKIDPPTLINLTLMAGVSMSCWLSALALGVFSQLKPLSSEALQAIFTPVFSIGLAGAILVGLGAVLIARAGAGREIWHLSHRS
ncbi:MAG: hypothetical protein L3J36_12570 [Rhodobacteraceae bacterium]|nr:hypothetical protein [Paracoccaceae bacterium]